ncbi:MAG: hypothetical protein ACLVJ8_03225 [Ruthenibacterium lactatiformans]
MEQATGARRAAVAMSGGVDSSVAALLLAQAGWPVRVTLRLYAGADAAPDGAHLLLAGGCGGRAPWHDGWASGTTPLISQKL